MIIGDRWWQLPINVDTAELWAINAGIMLNLINASSPSFSVFENIVNYIQDDIVNIENI